MPDITLRELPLLTPPRSAWPQLQAELGSKRAPVRGRFLFTLAAAAVLACAALLPRWMAVSEVAAPVPVAAQPAPPPSELDLLQKESAQLEALIDFSRDDSVTLASMESVASSVLGRVATIDALLSRDDLDPEAALPLWQERVLRLRQLLDLETTQQLLAANGDADPGAPVLAF